MNVVKPLVCVLSPRKVTLVKEGHETFKDIPHLWIKYLKAHQAYDIAVDFFLSHKEYTHMVIAPDDLVVQRQHYEALVKTLEQNDYPVFGGVCNCDMVHMDTLAICIDSKPNVVRSKRRGIDGYIWARADRVPEGIIEVQFAGMPFMFLARRIVEEVPLKGDTQYDPSPIIRSREPKAFDNAFCHECRERKIPIRVDTRVKMLHIKNQKLTDKSGYEAEKKYIGLKAPVVYLEIGDYMEDVTDKSLRYIAKLNRYNTNMDIGSRFFR